MLDKTFYKYIYLTPANFSNLVLISDGEYLVDLFFESSKNKSKSNNSDFKEDPAKFKDVIEWLDIYFSGEVPNFVPKYKINNQTPFRNDVINEIKKIKYGKTCTYGDISKILESKYKVKKMSSQAVGGAVSQNPICIIIPCHRVIGKNNKLVGYAGGIQNKNELLKLEASKKWCF